MAALARGDAEQLLRFIAEAESIGGDQPFTPGLLVELGRLISADSVVYNELDRLRRRRILLVGRADDEGDGFELDDETRWRVLLEEHPLCLRQQEGHFGAVKLSDFLTRRELHRTWVYNNFLEPFHTSTSWKCRFPRRSGTRRRFSSVAAAAATSPSATGSSSICCSRIWRGSGSRQNASAIELGARRARPR